MIAGIYNVRSEFFVNRPVIILSTIAVTAAIIQILIVADQACETRDALWPVMIDTKVEIWCATVRLATVNTYSGKLCLQPTLISPVVLELPRRKFALVFAFRVLKNRHSLTGIPRRFARSSRAARMRANCAFATSRAMTCSLDTSGARSERRLLRISNRANISDD